MIFISLFNYELKSVTECAFPINKNGKKNICWFWLTDSSYYIKLGETKLFELSSEFMKKHDIKSCFDDYYYIRQLEDLFEILPVISNSIPEDLYEYIYNEKKYKNLTKCFDNWIDEQKVFSDKDEILYENICSFLSYGRLDTGYLNVKCCCCFYHVSDQIIIHYDFEDFDEENNPIWTAKSGRFTLTYKEFLDEIENLLNRFFCDMEKQISNAAAELKDEVFYDIFVQRDKNTKPGTAYLFEEHEERKISFYSVLRSLKNNNCKKINWDEIRENIKFITLNFEKA